MGQKNNPETEARGKSASLVWLVYRTQSRGGLGVSGAPLQPKYSHRGLVLPELTPHQRREALARLAAGETQADIGRSFNVDATTIGHLQA